MHVVLIAIGVISDNISVNLFNEYSDYRTKIDFSTPKTPFSGGSGILVKGLLKPSSVLIAAIGTLLLAFAIGVYFTLMSHWSIALIVLIGLFSILAYTNFLTKYVMGELFSGLALGSLVVIGTFIALTAGPATALSALLPVEVIFISIPPGILTALLLLLNEFPDADADQKGGRKHIVIHYGKKRAAIIYSTGLFLTFFTIILLPIIGISSFWIYFALLPLPIAIKTSLTALHHYKDINKLIPALGSNVITVLSTDLLLAVTIFIHI